MRTTPDPANTPTCEGCGRRADATGRCDQCRLEFTLVQTADAADEQLCREIGTLPFHGRDVLVTATRADIARYAPIDPDRARGRR